MVHRHAPLDAVRRTVTRATRPALIPLRAAVSTLPEVVRPSESPDDPDPDPDSDSGPDASDADGGSAHHHLDELAELRDQLAAEPDDDPAGSVATDRASRATRSASAYLEARRTRLKRELAEAEQGDQHR